jgi:hypothetical protein
MLRAVPTRTACSSSAGEIAAGNGSVSSKVEPVVGMVRIADEDPRELPPRPDRAPRAVTARSRSSRLRRGPHARPPPRPVPRQARAPDRK